MKKIVLGLLVVLSFTMLTGFKRMDEKTVYLAEDTLFHGTTPDNPILRDIVLPRGTEVVMEYDDATGYKDFSYGASWSQDSTSVKYTDYNTIMQDGKFRCPTYFVDNTATSDMVIIGDSRAVQMMNTVGPQGATWICQEGAGVDWLENIALVLLAQTNFDGKRMFIMTGVNDVIYSGGNIKRYEQIVHDQFESFEFMYSGNRPVTFVSVNPVDGAYAKYNKGIDTLNSFMAQFNTPYLHASRNVDHLYQLKYLDTNSLMKANGFTTVDGVHYGPETYMALYNILLNS